MSTEVATTIADLEASSLPWRQVSVEERVAALTAWARDFELAPGELDKLAAGSGMSREMVHWGAETTVASLADGLDDLVSEALPNHGLVATAAVCGHVWASTLPTSGWVPVIGTLALGAAGFIRAPASQVGAAEVLVANLERRAPKARGALRATTWTSGGKADEALVENVGGLVVSGGDEAIRRFGRLVYARPRAPIPYLALGPGSSIAVVPRGSEKERGLSASLALDIAAYDQLGCLSPQTIWLEAEEHAEAFCDELAAALTEVEGRLPRGRVPVEVAAAIAQETGTARALGRVHEADGAVVLWLPQALPTSRPLYRTITVHPFAGGPDGLEAAIEAVHKVRVHSAAVAGGIDTQSAFAQVLGTLGASRVCAPGAMQTPPATWHHDGMRWLETFVRVTDLL